MYAQGCVCRVQEPINPKAIKFIGGCRSEDAWRGLVVELLREVEGRDKGWEEGDVQAIRRGWMLRGCELRTTVIAGSREILRTVIFGCDELLYYVVRRESCTTVSTVSSNFLYTTVLAVSLWYFVDSWLAVSKE
jgi:hypothetical protein